MMGNGKKRLVLASASPRRADLLAEMGFEFDVIPSNVDEVLIDGADAADEAVRLAVLKAEKVAVRAGPAIVIGADTLVALGGEILGKPRDRADARQMLARLGGSRHRVITGICVLDTTSGRRVAESISSTVTMRPMTQHEIDDYVESGEADGKAGAYAIQETADRFVLRVDGSVTNVVGLPTERLGEILAGFGALPRGSPPAGFTRVP